MDLIDYFENIEKFSLHDSVVSDIQFINNSVIFSFSEGFWLTNEKGKLIKQMQNCRLTYNFSDFSYKEAKLAITNLSKKSKNIPLVKFQKLVKKFGMRIGQEFRCAFSKHILIECFVNGKYLIETDDIKEILYEYER